MSISRITYTSNSNVPIKFRQNGDGEEVLNISLHKGQQMLLESLKLPGYLELTFKALFVQLNEAVDESSKNPSKKNLARVAECYGRIGLEFQQSGNEQSAKTFAWGSLIQFEKLTDNVWKWDSFIESLKLPLKEEVEVTLLFANFIQKASECEAMSEKLGLAYYDIGQKLHNLNLPNNAKVFFERSLTIFEKLPQSFKDSSIINNYEDKIEECKKKLII